MHCLLGLLLKMNIIQLYKRLASKLKQMLNNYREILLGVHNERNDKRDNH